MKGKIETYFSYGNYYKSKAEVFYPKTIQEIREICDFAHLKNRKITLAGSFHSFDNQNSGSDIVISLRKIDSIEYVPDKHLLIVGPGAIWGNILKEAYKHDCVPFICITGSKPTAGGTLSVNTNNVFSPGLGKEGKYCEEFDFLTTDGKLYTCSRTQNSHIFYGAIGGLGILGFIVKITYRLFYVGSAYKIKISCQNHPSVDKIEERFSLRENTKLEKLEDLKSQSSLFYMDKGEYKFTIYNRQYERVKEKEKTHFNIYLYIGAITTFFIRFFPNLASKIMVQDEKKEENKRTILRGLTRVYYGLFWGDPDYLWNKYVSKCLSIFGYKSKMYQHCYFIPLVEKQVTIFTQTICTLLKKYNLSFAMFDIMYIPKDEPFILSSSRYSDGFYFNITFFDRTNKDDLMPFFAELNHLCFEMGGKMNLAKNTFIKTDLLEKMHEKEIIEILALKKQLDQRNLLASNFFIQKFPSYFS
jgi:hypothetical protein